MTTGSQQTAPLSDTLVFPLGLSGRQFMMSVHITSTAWTSEHVTELGLHNPHHHNHKQLISWERVSPIISTAINTELWKRAMPLWTLMVSFRAGKLLSYL